MKKIFILLSFFTIFTFTIFNNSKASAQYNFADEYGVNMTYKTLYLYDIANPDFEFTGLWWENGTDTYIFEYRPVEMSLEEFIRFLRESVPYFMKLYTSATTLQYLSNYNLIPTDDIGWSQDDGYIYLIIKQDYFPDPDFILPDLGDLAEVIRVDTWVVTETTPDYQTGYNTGYQHGFGAGFSEGWDAKEEQINAQLPALLQAEYQIGYGDGYNEGYDLGLQVSQGEAYDKGYQDGYNESFIATIDNWLVPAIIIVMLLVGYFAIARKKQDGDI